MNQFTFTGKLKTTTLVLLGVGVLSLVLGIFGDPTGTRVWSNVLQNAVFFTGISFILLFLLCAKSLAYSGWQSTFKRVWEATSMFLPVGLVLMLIVGAGVIFGWHDLYEWGEKEVVKDDVLLRGKSAFLNVGWYIGGTIVIMGYWILTSILYRKWSLKEDTEGGLTTWKKTKVLSGFFLPIGGVTGIVLTWLWVMSVDAHWYSTMFGWYCLASWFVAGIAFTIMMLIWLKSKNYYPQVTSEHLHDLGKYLFGFSIFWTYLWFSQFMLIWYANIGEETIYFHQRRAEYPVLFYANLVINFVLPFLVLMRNSTKRKYGTLVFASLLVFMGHWMDFFLMVKPGVLNTKQHLEHLEHGTDSHDDATTTHLDDHTTDEAHADETHTDDGHAEGHASKGINFGYQLPGFIDFGMFFGFLGLYLFVFFTAFSRAPMSPTQDPFLAESLHHHT